MESSLAPWIIDYFLIHALWYWCLIPIYSRMLPGLSASLHLGVPARRRMAYQPPHSKLISTMGREFEPCPHLGGYVAHSEQNLSVMITYWLLPQQRDVSSPSVFVGTTHSKITVLPFLYIHNTLGIHLSSWNCNSNLAISMPGWHLPTWTWAYDPLGSH